MKFSLCIGAYRLVDFVELNLAQCRKLFGDDTPILVSDDRSPMSDRIHEIADEYGASYVVGNKRRSHFSGDIQCFINTAKFGELVESDVCLKISQRFIPAHQDFIDLIASPFNDPNVMMVVPGKPEKKQMARPGAAFYAGFGILSDFAAWRPSALTGEMIENAYRNRLKDVDDKQRGKHLVEVTLGWIMANQLNGKGVALRELANYQIGKPKMYLRKAMANRSEYAKLAEQYGITGAFDCREWSAIERGDYVPLSGVI